jgi:hypothetical protein
LNLQTWPASDSSVGYLYLDTARALIVPKREVYPTEANPRYQNDPSVAKSPQKRRTRRGRRTGQCSREMTGFPSPSIRPRFVSRRESVFSDEAAPSERRTDPLIRTSVLSPSALASPRAILPLCLCLPAIPATPPAWERPPRWMNKFLSKFPQPRQMKILSGPVRRRQTAKAR